MCENGGGLPGLGAEHGHHAPRSQSLSLVSDTGPLCLPPNGEPGQSDSLLGLWAEQQLVNGGSCP